jgi:hypothetical protein
MTAQVEEAVVDPDLPDAEDRSEQLAQRSFPGGGRGLEGPGGGGVVGGGQGAAVQLLFAVRGSASSTMIAAGTMQRGDRLHADEFFLVNRIEAQFTALRYFTLDGTDHPSHKEQASMIRRYIIWRNNHAYDQRQRRIVDKANVA